MKLVISLLMLISTSFSAFSVENIPAKTWLERLSQSLNQLNYSTSFVVVKNNQAEPYHWFHGVDENGMPLEILARLNGPHRDILRKGDVVSYIEPESPPYSVKSSVISSPIPAILSADINKIADFYRFISIGKSRVLGRVAQLVRLVPNDPDRYGAWLWVDQQTGLLLKFAIITRKGQLLEQVQFAHLEITEKMPENLKQLQMTELPKIIDVPAILDEAPFAWQVSWLPKGFIVIESNKHQMNGTKQPVEFKLFSDSLVDVSIYVAKSTIRNRDVEFVMDGATVALNQVVNGREISVVGKVPLKTAKKIADNITFAGSTSP